MEYSTAKEPDIGGDQTKAKRLWDIETSGSK